MTTHPKIGIRPIIDGRRGGIRESLEEIRMGCCETRPNSFLGASEMYAENSPCSDGPHQTSSQ